MFENLFLLLYVTCFFQVKKITLHEDFEIYYKGDDIAVFVLEVAVAYSEHVRPLCLPQIDEHLPPSAICYTGGWGYMNPTRQLLLLLFANNSFLYGIQGSFTRKEKKRPLISRPLFFGLHGNK